MQNATPCSNYETIAVQPRTWQQAAIGNVLTQDCERQLRGVHVLASNTKGLFNEADGAMEFQNGHHIQRCKSTYDEVVNNTSHVLSKGRKMPSKPHNLHLPWAVP